MFFAKKAKGFCIEFGEQSTLLARMSQAESPIVIEELREFPAGDYETIKEYVRTAIGKGPTGFVHTRCGVYPSRRIVRRHTLELKRVREPAYFGEIYSQQFRIEPEKFTMTVLNSNDGSDYDATRAAHKEVIFCGMPADEIIQTQDTLLANGVYPENLELGTVATLGGLSSYLRFKQIKSPVLLLEMSADSTQSFIVSGDGVDTSRPIASGIAAMIPVVQKELGLKDEESARKLFYSNTFDFTSMGGTLIKKLLKELQSLIGFYEVNTGQSIGSVLCTQLPANLGWLSGTMATALGVGTFKLDLVPWIESLGIQLGEGVSAPTPEDRWMGLFSLMANYNNASVSTATDQKK